MKVLYITGFGIAGSNVSLLNTITELRGRGVTETVIVPDTETCSFFKSNNVNCVIIPFKPSIWPVCIVWYHFLTSPIRFCAQRVLNIIALIRLFIFTKHFRPDLIHTNVSVIDVGYIISKFMKIPHLFHIREYCELDYKYKRYPNRRTFLGKLDQSYSIAITKDLFNYYNLKEDRSRVIYNGIIRKKEYMPIKKESYFLYVGGLYHEKGIDYLIEAFLSLAHRYPNIKLLICGSGNRFFVDNLISIINKEDQALSSRIVFLGQRNDVYQLMTKAKALIVPSLSEGFGRITAEAMFNDCLVIGNNTAGTKEQFDNGLKMSGGEIGLRYSNIQELKEAMEIVYNAREEEFRLIREKAFEVVNSLYTTEHNADEVLSFYNNILGM